MWMQMPHMKTTRAEARFERWFPGDSEMARRMRAFDWSGTSFGLPRNWPHNLRNALGLCLTSQFPIVLWWGADLNVLYNDAYIPFLGSKKHPQVLGWPGRDCWGEIWDVIGPMLEGVLATGQATRPEDLILFFDRDLPQEEVYVRFTCGPILTDEGRTVNGIFMPCTETTEQVVSARRLETLRKLGMAAAEARTVEAACMQAAEVLKSNPRDIAFSAIYTVVDRDTQARRMAVDRIPVDHSVFPPSISLGDGDSSPWPLAKVLRTSRGEEVNLDKAAVRIPGGGWPEPVRNALVLPIPTPHNHLTGFLIVGVSQHRVLDAAYRTFFDLVARHIGSAITDVHAYEVERSRAEALAEIDRARTTFFSDVSHEFRTPLTLMLGPLEDLLDKPAGVAPASREMLSLVYRNGRRLLKLVNRLLDFASVEAGRVQASYRPTDLSVFTAELASLFRSSVEKAGLRLIVNCPDLPEPVFVDRDMWEKIVLNLIANAFKYTMAGEISVGLRADSGAILSVHDTGTGIPAAELPNLFNRFYRFRDGRGRSHEGSGIGLSMVMELVKLHGGTVSVDSIDGEGSTFTVRIPFGCAHLPADRVGRSSTPASVTPDADIFIEEAWQWVRDGGVARLEAAPASVEGVSHLIADGKPKPRVLVADDNADMRDYLRHLLRSQYETIFVADGNQALRSALEQKPDLVLADVMMPGLNGFELVKALRAETGTAATSVILLSGRAGEEARIEGTEAGADDYITKPFSARDLLARVSGMVALARFRRRAIQREEELHARTVNILEGMNEGIVLVDSEWRMTYANAAAEQVTRMPRDRLLGMNHWEVFPATRDTNIERNLRRAMQNRVPVRFEHYYLPYGRWVEIGASPIRDGGLLLFAHDITERKRGEETARATETRLAVELEAMTQLQELGTRLAARSDLESALMEVLDDAIAMLAAAMGTIQLYDSQTGSLQIAAQRGFRKEFLDHFHTVIADDGSACGRAMKRGVRVIVQDVQSDPDYAPHRHFAASARYRAVQSTPLISRDGELLGVLSTHFRQPHYPFDRDLRMLDLYCQQAVEIVHRLGLENALRESESRFRALAEVSPGLIWQLDPNGNAVYTNPCYREMLGKASKDLLGTGWHQLVHPDDASAYISAVAQAQRQRTRLQHRVRVRNKYGEWRWLESNALPWFTSEGDYAGHVGISIDVTEAMQAAEACGRAERRTN
jgi:PAS domain S-box-containing protein